MTIMKEPLLRASRFLTDNPPPKATSLSTEAETFIETPTLRGTEGENFWERALLKEAPCLEG
jgi:hypothetical protein